MNTKSKKIVINPEYESLFAFESEKEKIEHNAQMISYRILSEVEKICEIKKLKKKDLAVGIGSSQSFITQLFRGNKSINTQIMAKFEDFLDISFDIRACHNTAGSNTNWFTTNYYLDLPSGTGDKTHPSYMYPCPSEANITDNFADKLTTENTLIQTAA